MTLFLLLSSYYQGINSTSDRSALNIRMTPHHRSRLLADGFSTRRECQYISKHHPACSLVPRSDYFDAAHSSSACAHECRSVRSTASPIAQWSQGHARLPEEHRTVRIGRSSGAPLLRYEEDRLGSRRSQFEDTHGHGRGSADNHWVHLRCGATVRRSLSSANQNVHRRENGTIDFASTASHVQSTSTIILVRRSRMAR